jgi:hypothetical protein
MSNEFAVRVIGSNGTFDVVESVADTSSDDLRGCVLAENVTIKKDEKFYCLSISFDFLCPNCGKRHWAEEFDGPEGLFSTIFWALKCGGVNVRMPWARTPQRVKKNIYGGKPS